MELGVGGERGGISVKLHRVFLFLPETLCTTLADNRNYFNFLSSAIVSFLYWHILAFFLPIVIALTKLGMSQSLKRKFDPVVRGFL